MPLFQREKVIAHNIGTKKWIEIDNEFDLAIADSFLAHLTYIAKRLWYAIWTALVCVECSICFTSLAKPILSKYKTDEIAVIADRLQTDKKFSDNLQCDFICVLTGETKRLDI